MAANILFNRGAISASQCISGGWDLIKENYWLFLGISLLAMVIGGCVPCVSLFLMGPIMVGVYHCLFARMRGETVELGMMFKGFEKFVPAMVIGLIQSIPGIIANVAQYGLQFSSSMLNKGGRRGGFDFFAPSDELAPFLAGGMLLVILIAVVVGVLFSFAWHITFIFALPLIADNEDLSIMDILKISFQAGWANPGGIIVLIILQALIALLGMLALCIGIFFVIPILQASNAVAFRYVFPEKTPQNPYNAPPSPDYYGGSFGNA